MDKNAVYYLSKGDQSERITIENQHKGNGRKSSKALIPKCWLRFKVKSGGLHSFNFLKFMAGKNH